MNRYDRGWTRGFGGGYGPRDRGGYGSDFASWGDAWGASPYPGSRGGGPGYPRQWGGPRDSWRGGYDRELYGRDYPGFGGYPGWPERGIHYGGGRGPGAYGGAAGGRAGYGPMEPRGGYAGGWEVGPGYDRGYGDRGYSRDRFVPEEAYRRHPELDRPQRHLGDRWPDAGSEGFRGEDLSDEEIRRAVRQNLFSDNWIDPERIEVEVSDHVVTLRGEVDDYLEARYAWDDAWEAAGVHGVVNQLTVRTDQPTEEAQGDVVPQTAGGKKKA